MAVGYINYRTKSTVQERKVGTAKHAEIKNWKNKDETNRYKNINEISGMKSRSLPRRAYKI